MIREYGVLSSLLRTLRKRPKNLYPKAQEGERPNSLPGPRPYSRRGEFDRNLFSKPRAALQKSHAPIVPISIYVQASTTRLTIVLLAVFLVM